MKLKKILFCTGFVPVLTVLLLVNCSNDPVGVNSGFGSISFNANLDLLQTHPGKVSLKKDNGIQAVIIGSATVQVSGAGMSTITKDFPIPNTSNSLSAKVDNIPVGTGRQLKVLLKTHSGVALIEGTAVVNIEAGKTSNATINFDLVPGKWLTYTSNLSEAFDSRPIDQAMAVRFTPERYPCFLQTVSVYIASGNIVDAMGNIIAVSNPFVEYGLLVLDASKSIIGDYTVLHSDFADRNGWHQASLWEFNHEFTSGDFYIAIVNISDPAFVSTPWIGVQTASFTNRSFLFANNIWTTYGFSSREWTPMIQVELAY